MDTLRLLLNGFQVALQPVNLLAAATGVVIGQLIGVLPGIGPSAAIAILLPVTFDLDPATSMITFIGIYYGAMYGGTITSVLLRIPGESSSVMTMLDGYEMARQGRAGAALGIAAFGSFLAGTAGIAALMFLARPLTRVALAFGPAEFTALLVLAFSLTVYLTGRDKLKGAIAVLLGLWLSTVGIDLISGLPRFTFGQLKLLDGVQFIPVAVGLFGIAEILATAHQVAPYRVPDARFTLRGVLPAAADWLASRWAILRGTVIGFLVGMLPGAGATAASMISYTVEKRASRDPDRFGRGAIEGVAGPESANNAAAVGAMVPLLTLGLPGSATTAVMLGGLMLFGLRPGPLLFEQHPQFAWGIIASMHVSNFLLVLLNLLAIPLFVSVLRLRKPVLYPSIIALAVIGTFSLENHLFEAWLALGFAIFGYIMMKLDYPAAPLVLALVLGNTLEESARQALLLSHGSLLTFVTRPLSATLLGLTLLLVLSSFLRRRLAAAAPEMAGGGG
ncbi:MAG TPA: tripartite tricarboxylate transporter permease [bacterium]|nr:tripartite tricarboxylate transporter permease [bacterium]